MIKYDKIRLTLKAESRKIGSLNVRTTGPKVPPRRNAVSLSANYPAGTSFSFSSFFPSSSFVLVFLSPSYIVTNLSREHVRLRKAGP